MNKEPHLKVLTFEHVFLYYQDDAISTVPVTESLSKALLGDEIDNYTSRVTNSYRTSVAASMQRSTRVLFLYRDKHHFAYFSRVLEVSDLLNGTTEVGSLETLAFICPVTPSPAMVAMDWSQKTLSFLN